MKTNICLFGLSLFSGNKGCEALAYAFLDMLSEIAVANNTNFNIFLFQFYPSDNFPTTPKQWNNLNIECFRLNHRSQKHRKLLKDSLKKADIAFDFTEGDSFTDLYGLRRFISQTLVKTIAIKNKVPFVLAPQTYGPFKSRFSKIWASWIVKKAYEVFSRDEESAILLEKMTKRKAIITTDIAMALKAAGAVLPATDKTRIGINVSALLWNGGYTGNNQFNLTVDYKKYIKTLLCKLSEQRDYEIYLIPHVIDTDYDSCENDLKICKELQKQFPNCTLFENLQNPSELKNLISQMSVFTGARMHSTIAAFSTGVPVIPFAYSKKFENLFGALGYEHVIDGRKIDTDEAVNLTLRYINNKEELKDSVQKAYLICNERLNVFSDLLSKLF